MKTYMHIYIHTYIHTYSIIEFHNIEFQREVFMSKFDNSD